MPKEKEKMRVKRGGKDKETNTVSESTSARVTPGSAEGDTETIEQDLKQKNS
jgi:hypothetical protein